MEKKRYTTISKYIRAGVFPRYYFHPYSEKSRYTKETYKEAKSVYENCEFASEEFVEKVSPYISVLLFPIDSEKVHPCYAEVMEAAGNLKSLCEEYFPEETGIWFLAKSAKMTPNERRSLLDVAEGATVKAFTLYCNNKPLELSCILYSREEGESLPYNNPVKKAMGKFLDAVLKAPWLPLSSWKSVVFSEPSNKDGVTLLDKKMSELYISTVMKNGYFSYLREYDLSKEGMIDTLFTREESNCFSPIETNDISDICKVVSARRGYTGRELMFRTYTKEMEESFKNSLKIDLGDKYIAKEAYKGICNRQLLERGNIEFSNPHFWSDVFGHVDINSFVIRGEMDHPDYKLIKSLCADINKLIRVVSSDVKMNSIWYLTPVDEEDETDELYHLYSREDRRKFYLYCQDECYGFIRPCFIRDGLHHSELEMKLAELIYIISSVPWLDMNSWGSLVLPCSGIALRNFNGDPAIVGECILGKLKCCWSENIL